MRYHVSTDTHAPLVDAVCTALRSAGHRVEYHGPLAGEADQDWPLVTRAAVEPVARGIADGAVVLCWTGTGASIYANKIQGIRCALCVDAETARGARRYNDANVLALSVRLTTAAMAQEIVAAWLATGPDATDWNRVQLDRLAAADRVTSSGSSASSSS
jgi:ribose 5-phosphate isomerase B